MTTLSFKNDNSGNSLKGCICASSNFDTLLKFTRPRLYSFYYDLNGTYTKFPSVVCSGFSNLTENDTVFYKSFGNKSLAF